MQGKVVGDKMTDKQISIQNLVTALKLGLIAWPEYLYRYRMIADIDAEY
jgi:hypothetical protein